MLTELWPEKLSCYYHSFSGTNIKYIQCNNLILNANNLNEHHPNRNWHHYEHSLEHAHVHIRRWLEQIKLPQSIYSTSNKFVGYKDKWIRINSRYVHRHKSPPKVLRKLKGLTCWRAAASFNSSSASEKLINHWLNGWSLVSAFFSFRSSVLVPVKDRAENKNSANYASKWNLYEVQ